MHIISKTRLKEFWTTHLKAESGLISWYKVTQNCYWENFSDVRKTYPSADLVKKLTVFNICGNNYRLITKIQFSYKKVFIRAVLTHSEYDEGNWKRHPCLGI
jgi:mRNA interferase HigB